MMMLEAGLLRVIFIKNTSFISSDNNRTLRLIELLNDLQTSGSNLSCHQLEEHIFPEDAYLHLVLKTTCTLHVRSWLV